MADRLCACPRDEAVDCFRARYDSDLTFRREIDDLIEADVYALVDDCFCECDCHVAEHEPRVVMPSECEA